MEYFWVFGYGSLMWRPGFEYEERRMAYLAGLHRALCVFSYVHRGTPDKPGLVMGLDRGGACRGVAFRIAAARWPQTLAYLREREQVTMVYKETVRQIRILDDPRQVTAVTYVVDRGHRQYAGKLSREELLRHVLQGNGRSGPNPDYVLNTLDHLRELGMKEPTLEWLGARLRSSGEGLAGLKGAG
jgi:cation transport protein ChaC